MTNTNIWQRALTAATATLAFIPSIHAGISLSVDDEASIKAGAAIAANDLMKLYVNNASGTTPIEVGTFAKPIYWWEAGAVWGGLVDYWAYTGDASYVATVTQALLAQKGPANDFMNVEWEKELGNDDQVFWALTAMSAAEQGFPEPSAASAAAVTNPPSAWLDLAVNTFNTQVARWDMATCNGGLRWQVYATNNGYTYKNSVSNGGLFQLAARLHRYTGNATYSDWATKVWDWSVGVGAVNAQTYDVYDGAGVDQNCTQFDKTQWSYNVAMYLYGAAAMYNGTDGAAPWDARTRGLLDNAARRFFSPPAGNASDVAYEAACEPLDSCNTDQLSFKAYLARWLAKTSVLAPDVDNGTALPLLRASALGAAAACSGEADGTSCGYRWDTGSYDGKAGVGPQLAAMEVMQALLVVAPGKQAAAAGESSSSVAAAAVISSTTTTPLPVQATPTTMLTSTVSSTSTSTTTSIATTTATSTTAAAAAPSAVSSAAVMARWIAAAAAKAQPADAMF
ncbi:mannan endo-alpha-mannosidase [Diplodia corticola]|uniref:Mannan endo-1,6-alpha-mannosidase n=1 Tax=Diplodia corticola TaxID=236234 RepID=A0A1J9RIF5_9PEZI|nr:mannan endo-alpha-mannosidase [Diplodia corticola]OJD40432.1 mannan endo-alpha-mannosidase [Diplodia corticola]